MITRLVEIFDIRLHDFDYPDLLDIVYAVINGASKKCIAYVSTNQANLACSDISFKAELDSFDYLHADGTGIYIASKILSGKKGLSKRISGSDFYPILALHAEKCGWKIFILGDDDHTLNKIRLMNKSLNICGMRNGFNDLDASVVQSINKSKADILIVGLGSPLQEKWIASNKNKLETNLIIAVGDGTKVFAGTKIRGPKIARTIGMEWLIRLCSDPRNMWRRYLIGIPLFIFRVLKKKIKV